MKIAAIFQCVIRPLTSISGFVKSLILSRRFRWDASLTSKAKKGDTGSIETMFRTFIGTEESIHECAYLGVRGLWGFGHHCWAAVTDRRFSTIVISPFRGVRYQDIFADRIDRVRFHQPSGLVYFMSAVGTALLAPGIQEFIFDNGQIASELSPETGWGILLFAALFACYLVMVFYFSLAVARRLIKRGIECKSRNICVDVFCEPSSTGDGLRLLRQIAHLREHRLKMVIAS